MPTPRMKHIREPNTRVSVEEFHHMHKELADLQSKYEEKTAELEKASRENSEHEATMIQLQKQNRSLTGKLTATESKLAATEGRRDELDALKIENDILRRRLQRFDHTVSKLEQKVGKGGVSSSTRTQRVHTSGTVGGGSTLDGSPPKSRDSPRAASPTASLEASTLHMPSVTDRTLGSTTIGGDLQELHSLTEQIHMAKTEAIQFTTQGKRQLAEDVKYLYRLLQRAKEEHTAQEQVKSHLQKRIGDLQKELKETRYKASLQERAFTITLKQSMDRTDKRVRKAETAAEQRKNQIVKLVEWAQNRHAAFTALTKDLHLQLVMEKEEAAGILEEDSAAMQVVLDELETLELPHERKPIAIQRAEAAAAAKAQGHRRSKGHGSFSDNDGNSLLSEEEYGKLSDFAREMLDVSAPG